MSGFRLSKAQESKVEALVKAFPSEKWCKTTAEVTVTDNGYLHVALRDRRSTVGAFAMVEMPGCCGALISTGTYTYYQGKGIGQEMQRLKEYLAQEMGYALLICTVVDENDVQKHVLEKSGWVKGATWTNWRTENPLAVWTKQVPVKPAS